MHKLYIFLELSLFFGPEEIPAGITAQVSYCLGEDGPNKIKTLLCNVIHKFHV